MYRLGSLDILSLYKGSEFGRALGNSEWFVFYNGGGAVVIRAGTRSATVRIVLLVVWGKLVSGE